MARITRRQLLQMVERLEPRVRDSFLAAIADIRNQAAVQQVAELIAAGRVDDMMSLLGLSEARFSPLAEAMRSVYAAGGDEAVSEMPVRRASLVAAHELTFRSVQLGRLVVSFNMRNPRAENWLRTESSGLITAIVEDQRVLIRELLAEGMRAGRNPRTTALDLVGRIGETGRRTGGVIGLTAEQARYVAAARAELASGNPAAMRRYLQRLRRDSRFDGVVRSAIAAGRPVATAKIAQIAGRYADRMLQLRGENIARTESSAAFNAAREEAFQQAVDAGNIRPDNVIAEWDSVGDHRTRDSHASMHGQERLLGQPFVSPSGARMRFPGDTSLGAGPEEIVNCRCAKLYRVDLIAETMQRGG